MNGFASGIYFTLDSNKVLILLPSAAAFIKINISPSSLLFNIFIVRLSASGIQSCGCFFS